MPNRYTVAEGHEFNYPADLSSFQIIKSAGGRSKLTEQEVARVKYKTVKAGQDCSDMPKSSLEIYLQRGWVIESKDEIKIEDKETPIPAVIKEVTNG
jgi:hypothetical protein